MAIQIALFNHKGGVSKTTTTFNLGWMLANKGKKVIIVDCDPQCNLTGMVLGYKNRNEFVDEKEFDQTYKSSDVNNIKSGLSPAFESRPISIEAVNCIQLPAQPNLYLLPGHIGLAEYEVTLGIAQELSGSLVTLQNLPGSFRYLFNITAEKYAADYILVDMSPSLSSINQNLLMTSDYFIIPMAPDSFSVMAIESLVNILPKWASWAKQASNLPSLKQAAYPFEEKNPKFIGPIIQNFRRRGGIASSAYQKWIDLLERNVREKLVPVLQKSNMLMETEKYASIKISPGDSLIMIPDFNSLIALTHQYNVPVYELSDEQLGQSGVVLQQMQASMSDFNRLFSDAAEKIITITDNE